MNAVKPNRQGAQGDILATRIDSIPKNAVEKKCDKQIVLSNSETGHVHAIDTKLHDVTFYTNSENPMVAYLEVKSESADIVHHRHYDTHGTVALAKGCWEIRRQREMTPNGWQQVVD